MSIYDQLLQIQQQLKAPKNQVNKFGGYNYRSCEDILEAVKPLLSEGTTLFISDDVVMIGERYYVKTTVTFGAENHRITVTAYAREEESKKGMDGSQITGAASSYARKYALNALFLIDDTKDSDATNNNGKEDDKPPPPKAEAPPKQVERPETATKEQITAIQTLFTTNKVEGRDLILSLISEQIGRNIKSSKELTKPEASKVIDWLKEKWEVAA